MIRNNPEANIIWLVDAIGLSSKLCGEIKNWLYFVDLVKIVDPLHKKGDSFKAHSGINVLGWKLAEYLEAVFAITSTALILHENEVPNFYEPILVSFRPTIDPVIRTTIKIDFGTRPSRAWLTC